MMAIYRKISQVLMTQNYIGSTAVDDEDEAKVLLEDLGRMFSWSQDWQNSLI